jgi:hypothetical protein
VETGKNARLEILNRNATESILSPFEKHHWKCEVIGSYPNGEYLVIQVTKGRVQFKLAFLYSCATENEIYKKLDGEVGLIVLNGSFYNLESYAYGITTEVIELKNLQKYIVQWNSSASDGKVSFGGQEQPVFKPKEFNSHIQSEQPINQVWSRIRQFKTKGLAEKLIIQLCKNSSIRLNDEEIEAKASGLAFCIQNGCDYFEVASKQKLNQRIVSLYYGAIAFASAEMLASPKGSASLQKVEEMTKSGHGLYTYDSVGENDFEGFVVGVLSNGFFKNWVEFLGCNTSSFPDKKPRKPSDIDLSTEYATTLIELFSHIPELEDLFRMVTQTPTNWLNFIYASEANGVDFYIAERSRETYVTIIDVSCSKTVEDIAKIDLPIEQIEYIKSEYPGAHFKALVRHPEHEYWDGAIKQHRSPFTASSYILPIFGDVGEYRCITTVILYALSILVRYRPSIWREVVSGRHENYLALTDEFLSVYERLAPELFLESLLDKKVSVFQSGSIYAQT